MRSTCARSGLVQTFPNAQPPCRRNRALIELSLASATVRLPPEFDAQELRSIVQVLAALG